MNVRSMKKYALIALGVALPIAILLVLLTFTLGTPASVAFIRVVDATGRPIRGATIMPDGLRPKKGGGHYTWSAEYDRAGLKPTVVQTGADGYAKVVYPFYVREKLETGELSFVVDHPEFCAERPFRVVAASPPQNASLKEKSLYLIARLSRKVSSHPDPVVLQRGATVNVAAYIATKENVVTNVQAQISRLWPAGTNFWRRDGHRLSTTKAPAGKTFLRAMHLPDDGPFLFSDPVVFNATPGHTNNFALELKPGVRLNGRLEESVPRPVRDGRVCIHVYMQNEDGRGEAPIWTGWRPLNEDGTFAFESLPEGRLEIMALCDGFISRNGSLPGGMTTSQRVPQTFDFHAPLQEVTLAMEPAATCEITVLDNLDQPLSGATAFFWPNILWGGNGSTIFGSDVFNTEDFFRGLPFSMESIRRRQNAFHAVTDSQGVARVRNLPPGVQAFTVQHARFDMPIKRSSGSAERSTSVTLTGGETGKVAVTLQKKGTEVLTH